MRKDTQNVRITLNGSIYNPKDIGTYTDKTEDEKWLIAVKDFILEWISPSNHIEVMTSGSTGAPKKIRLPKTMMAESAQKTGSFLRLRQNDKALLCLPAEFIAGKMMIVRAFVLGLDLYCHKPESNPQINQNFDFCAMTPHQLATILREKPQNLNRISKLILGGGSIEKELIEKISQVNTECFLSFGMTETSSHFALQRLNGLERSDYFELIDDHIQINRSQGGKLKISGGFLGKTWIETNDIVEIIDKNKFRWLGRADFVINSGGIKIHPEQLEQKLTDIIDVPFLITGTEDPVFHQRVALILEADSYDIAGLLDKINKLLSSREKPVRIYRTDSLPRTKNGKILRSMTIEKEAKLLWTKTDAKI